MGRLNCTQQGNYPGFNVGDSHQIKEKTMTLTLGQSAPDFSLPSHTGAKVKLSDYHGKNVVLAFFPLAWTPV